MDINIGDFADNKKKKKMYMSIIYACFMWES